MPSQKKRNTKQQQQKQTNGMSASIKTISAPASRSNVVTKMSPRMTTTKNGNVIVRNTEIAINTIAVAAAGAFTSNGFSLMPISLAWLNNVAINFAKYTWRKARFIYVPYCSTTTAGRIAMGLVYDTADSSSTTVAEVMALNKGVISPVWGNNAGNSTITIDVDVNNLPLKKYQFITSAGYSALTSATDRNMYNPCLLQIGTDNGVAGNVGSILLEYEIELMEPMVAARQA